MKTMITSLLMGSLCFLASAQDEITNAPQWQVTLHVVDENGSSVSEADAFASYYLPPPPNATEAGSRKSGLTDTNGLLVLTARSGPSIICGADKAGYYSSTGVTLNFSGKAGGEWQPWNSTLDIVLKQIHSPISMYAKAIDSEPPVKNKVVGYDLSAGDWVAPYGRGEVTDVIFLEQYTNLSLSDYDYTLTVTFPNKGDGIQSFTLPDNVKGSGLKSPYEAPEDGYQPQVKRVNISHPPTPVVWDYDANRRYFIRVRTVLDENGNVKSALYGKIYGDFMTFKYYINPTPNSRNIEFAPGQNLLKDLPDLQQVKDP